MDSGTNRTEIDGIVTPKWVAQIEPLYPMI